MSQIKKFDVQADSIYSPVDDKKIKQLKKTTRIIFLFFWVALIWSYFARLDEVSVGTGKVVPITKEQVIQSLEGGVLSELYVHEDTIVEAGQILAQLDPAMSEASIKESQAKYRATLATIARLKAEISQTDLVFPPELEDHLELRKREIELFNSRKKSLDDVTRWINESINLIESELKISQSLTNVGAASNVEVLRLKRQLAELSLKKSEVIAEYVVQAREDLTKISAEAESLSAIISGKTTSLTRTTFRSPVRGIVKNIEVSTIGGVIPPNGKLMDIVPLDTQLLIETRISPRDIAFIHPNQRATVKISAYDYAIYGGLEGAVSSISADTMRDEIKPDTFYYRVFIKTKESSLKNKKGQEFAIVPGMIASVDIHTGNKTVFEYLIKPFNRAQEALRER